MEMPSAEGVSSSLSLFVYQLNDLHKCHIEMLLFLKFSLTK